MRFAFLGAALVVASVPAYADDIMANYIGNTVIAQNQLGVSKVHYRANHTFGGVASGKAGEIQLSGSWNIDGKGQLCRRYENAPVGSPNPFCTPWESHKIGDTWTMSANGQTAQVSLVAGKQ
jgi:hypothetical protein